MTREQKIQFLALVEAGAIDTNEFKEISNDEQAKQILLRHTKNSGGVQAKH